MVQSKSHKWSSLGNRNSHGIAYSCYLSLYELLPFLGGDDQFISIYLYFIRMDSFPRGTKAIRESVALYRKGSKDELSSDPKG